MKNNGPPDTEMTYMSLQVRVLFVLARLSEGHMAINCWRSSDQPRPLRLPMMVDSCSQTALQSSPITFLDWC